MDFLNGEYIELVSEPVIEKGNVITLEVPKYDKNGKIILHKKEKHHLDINV